MENILFKSAKGTMVLYVGNKGNEYILAGPESKEEIIKLLRADINSDTLNFIALSVAVGTLDLLLHGKQVHSVLRDKPRA